MQPLISTKNLSINFFGLHALSDFNFSLYEKEIVGLIGPNGAGKTTVFNLLTGVYAPTSGSFSFLGKEIKHKQTYQLARMGITRTFQNIRLFKYMTVLDNVKAALNFKMKYNYFSGMLRLKSYWQEEQQITEEALALLRIFDLERLKDVMANSLSYGAQRKLEIARALATNPKVLLLDEPAAGMNSKETEELMATIKKIRDHFEIAILLIEHDMKLVLGICERVYVLDHGEIIATGNPYDVVNQKQVIAAYLGDSL